MLRDTSTFEEFLLTESLSYNYKLPSDREKRIYDFYVLDLYKSLVDHPATLKKGIDQTRMG